MDSHFCHSLEQGAPQRRKTDFKCGSVEFWSSAEKLDEDNLKGVVHGGQKLRKNIWVRIKIWGSLIFR